MLDAGTRRQIVVLFVRCAASDRSSMAGFLNRHSAFDNVCLEMVRALIFPKPQRSATIYTAVQTNRLANIWITEFHISFYRILPQGSKDIDSAGSKNFVRCRVDPTLVVPQTTSVLVKGTRGFRILGDMYDRSWTCWILSRVPGKSEPCSREEHSSLSDRRRQENLSRWHVDSLLEGDTSWQSWLSGKDGFHAQRRVLELRLFEKMASEAYESTDEILRQVDSLRHDVSQSYTSRTSVEMLITIRRPNYPTAEPTSPLSSSANLFLACTKRSPSF
jgi:hypothetical protein